MTTPKLPSAEEYCLKFRRKFTTKHVCENCDAMRTYGNAVLEAAAEVADYVASLKGSTLGAGTAKRAAYEIRALKEDP